MSDIIYDCLERYRDIVNGSKNIRAKVLFLEQVKRAERELAQLRADNARLTALVGELVDILDSLGGDHNFPDSVHGKTLARALAEVREAMEEK